MNLTVFNLTKHRTENTGRGFNSEQKLNFSRPGRPPKRFLPPQFSSTPPLLSSSQSTPTNNTSKQVKPAYEGESMSFDYPMKSRRLVDTFIVITSDRFDEFMFSTQLGTKALER